VHAKGKQFLKSLARVELVACPLDIVLLLMSIVRVKLLLYLFKNDTVKKYKPSNMYVDMSTEVPSILDGWFKGRQPYAG
jgi:hypothetical protein